MTTGRINQVSYFELFVTTAPIDLPKEISESVYIGELAARLGGYALTSITCSRP